MSAEVELLRKAAQTMRDNAESASAGPWSAGDVDDEGCVSLMYGDYGWYITGPAGSPEFADTEQGKADAIHVASWHPAVALAVADWLQAVAEAGFPNTNELESALTVASTYLGGQP